MKTFKQYLLEAMSNDDLRNSLFRHTFGKTGPKHLRRMRDDKMKYQLKKHMDKPKNYRWKGIIGMGQMYQENLYWDKTKPAELTKDLILNRLLYSTMMSDLRRDLHSLPRESDIKIVSFRLESSDHKGAFYNDVKIKVPMKFFIQLIPIRNKLYAITLE